MVTLIANGYNCESRYEIIKFSKKNLFWHFFSQKKQAVENPTDRYYEFIFILFLHQNMNRQNKI
jgi:hypothetical protein